MQVLGHHSAASLPPTVSGADVALPNLTSSYVYPLVYPVLQTNILERVCMPYAFFIPSKDEILHCIIYIVPKKNRITFCI